MKRQTRIVWTVAKVSIAVTLAGWCALLLRRWDRYFGLSLPAWSRAVGVIFLVLSGLLVLVCGGILSTRDILETPGDRFFPKEFVASGPFRYVRNPMSLGGGFLLLGLGLFELSVTILLLAATWFLFQHLNIVYVEEPGLERRFGDSYCTYKRSVKSMAAEDRRPKILTGRVHVLPSIVCRTILCRTFCVVQ